MYAPQGVSLSAYTVCHKMLSKNPHARIAPCQMHTGPFERLVSHTFPLERISEAFHQAEWLRREGAPLRVSRVAVSM